MSNPRRTFPGWEIGILLIYAVTRFHRLTAFPLFIDEAFHIRWARDVWAMQPLHAAPDGKLLIPIAAAMLWPFANALWVGRAALVLIGVMGLAGIMAMTRQLFGRGASMLAAVLWITLPYAFFYERMVMADSLAASLAMIACALIVGALLAPDARRGIGLAILAGGALALTVLAKLPMLPYLILPALGWVLLARRRATWGRVAVMYGVSLIILAPITMFAIQRGGIGFGNAARFSSTEATSLSQRLTGNMQMLFDWMPPYVTGPLLVLAIIGLFWAIEQRKGRALWIAALMVLPVAEFTLASTYLVARYFLPAAAPALVLIAALFFWSAKHFPGFRLQGLGTVQIFGAGILFAAMIMGVRFQMRYFANPTEIRLPPPDLRDYVRHSTSGFGLVDGVDWMREEATTTPITVICQEQITCARVSIYLYNAPNITVSVRDILTPGWVDAEEAAGRAVLLADDMPSLSEPFDPGTEYTLTLARSFARPGETSTFNLYTIHATP